MGVEYRGVNKKRSLANPGVLTLESPRTTAMADGMIEAS